MKHKLSRAGFALSMMIGIIAANPIYVGAQSSDTETSGDTYDYRSNQTESGTPNPGDENPTGDPADVPVDGGLGFLLAAGAGYGANKLRKYRQEKRNIVK